MSPEPADHAVALAPAAGDQASAWRRHATTAVMPDPTGDHLADPDDAEVP